MNTCFVVMVHQENETEFTICSFYTIPKISFSYNKRILSCNVTRKAQTNNETEDVDTKTFEIIVRGNVLGQKLYF